MQIGSAEIVRPGPVNQVHSSSLSVSFRLKKPRFNESSGIQKVRDKTAL